AVHASRRSGPRGGCASVPSSSSKSWPCLLSSRLGYGCLAPEGEAQGAQQGAAFVIGLCGGGDGDVHAAQLVNLVVVDLGKDDLLAHAQGIVAMTVEGLGVQAAEVAHTRDGNRHQTVQEFVHTIAT